MVMSISIVITIDMITIITSIIHMGRDIILMTRNKQVIFLVRGQLYINYIMRENSWLFIIIFLGLIFISQFLLQVNDLVRFIISDRIKYLSCILLLRFLVSISTFIKLPEIQPQLLLIKNYYLDHVCDCILKNKLPENW